MNRSRFVRGAALAAFAAQFAIADAILRRPPLRVWIPAALASGALWWLLAVATFGRQRRFVRGGVALAASWLLVVQALFFRYYHVFLDDDATQAARHMWSDAKPILVAVLPVVAIAATALGVVEFGFLSFAAAAAPATKRRRWVLAGVASVGLVALVAGPPLRDASPDVQALWSLRSFLHTHEARAARATSVPTLQPGGRARIPNVLFVLTESVRKSDYDVDDAPLTAELTRGRVDFEQARSVASYTEVAVASLLTSRPPTDAESDRMDDPWAFDFVRAIRSDAVRPRIVYWSAQTDSVFDHHDVRGIADAYATVDDLVGHPVADIDDVTDGGVDRLLATKVEADLPRIAKPFFLTAHLSGTHAPYFVDDAHAPYVPYRHTVTWAGLPELHSAYRDSILAQDESVARILRAFFAAVGDEPWVVFFTSDHGEAFGEHKAIHHGQSLYEEQTHVPMWVLAGNGALDAGELAALRSHAGELVTHLDFVPTLLDVYGVLDAFPLTAYRKRFAGRSWLRADPPASALPMTNCTDIFPCPVRTWGMLGPTRELVAQPWDGDWVCVGLSGGAALTPESARSDAACAALRSESRTWFPTLPNGAPNRP